MGVSLVLSLFSVDLIWSDPRSVNKTYADCNKCWNCSLCFTCIPGTSVYSLHSCAISIHTHMLNSSSEIQKTSLHVCFFILLTGLWSDFKRFWLPINMSHRGWGQDCVCICHISLVILQHFPEHIYGCPCCVNSSRVLLEECIPEFIC